MRSRNYLTSENRNEAEIDNDSHDVASKSKLQKHRLTWLVSFKTFVVLSIVSVASVSLWVEMNASVQPAVTDKNEIMGIGYRDKKVNFRSASRSTFTVDILSVSSIKQLDLLRAQEKTMGSHVSVRNFFNATELDDADPTCHQDITWDHVSNVSAFCRSHRRALSHIFKYLRGNFASTRWLQKKKNPVGWLCAQTRPASGIMKVNKHYKSTGEPLPDYLVVMDDDTYYNMKLFESNFKQLDSSKDIIFSGCLVRLPINQVNFTFPFGGFGSILSKGSLMKIFQTIDCPQVNNFISHDASPRCRRLQEDNVGELKYFSNGMNLAELMYKYSSAEKYRNVNNWTSGFCMHSVRKYIIYQGFFKHH